MPILIGNAYNLFVIPRKYAWMWRYNIKKKTAFSDRNIFSWIGAIDYFSNLCSTSDIKLLVLFLASEFAILLLSSEQVKSNCNYIKLVSMHGLHLMLNSKEHEEIIYMYIDLLWCLLMFMYSQEPVIKNLCQI